MLQERNYERGGGEQTEKKGKEKKTIAAVWCAARQQPAGQERGHKRTRREGIKKNREEKKADGISKAQTQTEDSQRSTHPLPPHYHFPKSLTLQTRRRQAIAAAYDALQESNEQSEEGTHLPKKREEKEKKLDKKKILKR